MDPYAAGAAGLLGLIVGSFLNVVIHRLPRGESIVRPRSRCPRCRRPLPWYENLPVLSYLALRGRCRGCGGRISPRYPLVELLTAVLFSLLWLRLAAVAPGAPPGTLLVGFLGYAPFLGGLVAAAWIDLGHTILPDEITKPGMWLGPLAALLFPYVVRAHFTAGRLGWGGLGAHAEGFLGSLLGMTVGAGLIWCVAVAGRWVFRKEAMGFGDVKFLGMIGAFLGPVPALLSFFLACLSGAVVGLLVYALRRRRYMPFGPYLALGAVLMVFAGDRILFLVTDWWPRVVSGMLR